MKNFFKPADVDYENMTTKEAVSCGLIAAGITVVVAGVMTAFEKGVQKVRERREKKEQKK